MKSKLRRLHIIASNLSAVYILFQILHLAPPPPPTFLFILRLYVSVILEDQNNEKTEVEIFVFQRVLDNSYNVLWVMSPYSLVAEYKMPDGTYCFHF